MSEKDVQMNVVYVLEQRWVKPGQSLLEYAMLDYIWDVSYHPTRKAALAAIDDRDSTLVWWNIAVVYRP